MINIEVVKYCIEMYLKTFVKEKCVDIMINWVTQILYYCLLPYGCRAGFFSDWGSGITWYRRARNVFVQHCSSFSPIFFHSFYLPFYLFIFKFPFVILLCKWQLVFISLWLWRFLFLFPSNLSYAHLFTFFSIFTLYIQSYMKPISSPA